ncbi:MAG TPA: TonB-dependent receptor [Longimicrobiaceae bacterium]|nr:TonB-dependent receptor [Longimicrobiaceae bacterium]
MQQRRRWTVPFLLLLGLAAAPPLATQAGAVAGRVTDAASQAPVAGATVTASTGGAAVGDAVTGQDGRYRIANLAPGTYALTITQSGYEPRRGTVRVGAGATATFDASLTVRETALDAIVVTASRRAERAQEAPASVAVVSAKAVEERPVVSASDHLRATPGVDIAQNGIFNNNVVVRGFNAAFSSSLALLTDYRIASVPGLQVNRVGSISLVNEDLSRIEVVLGPGAALYGPNTANGIVHLITKSPLDDPGTSLSVSAGERDAFMGTFRTAQRITENLGFKVSGSYLRADEWLFVDTAEVRLQGEARARLEQFRTAQRGRGLGEAQIQDSIARDPSLFALTRVGVRKDDARRYGFDGRVDWRPRPGLSAVLQAGQSSNSSVDLTGISASVQDDFSVSYVQGRVSWNRLFAQVYREHNDAGGTYTARTGASVFDESKLWVGQVQHGFGLAADRQQFTYGLDLLYTLPESRGTVYGRNEDDDEVTQVGAYLQSETRILPTLNLVLAGRVDHHSVLDDQIFSPRAGLVFTPREGQSFRATYNRAFQAPTAINLFLDRLSSRSGPYAVQAIAPGAQGFNFHLPNGQLAIRSPFNSAANGGGSTRIAYDPAVVSRLAINFLVATGQITPAEAGRLFAANPNFTVIGRNPQTGKAGAFDPSTVQDLPGIEPELSEVFEVGYRGLFANRLLVTADLWRLERENFISQLFAPAPLLMVSGTQVAQFLAANGIAPERAAALAGVVARTPIGVVSAAENDILTDGIPILISYKNYANVDLTGMDLSAQYLMGRWRVAGNASFVSDNYFSFGPDEQPIALNAPKRKGALALGYDDDARGINGEIRGRYVGGFPVYSGVYIGNSCVEPQQGLGDCVEAATLVDLVLGYRVPGIRGTTLQLSVTNLFDEKYQSFVGVPAIGRLALLRLRYDF